MITSAILFLSLATAQPLIETDKSNTKKVGVSELVQAVLDLSDGQKETTYTYRVHTDNASDREKFCALLQAEIGLTCKPSKPTLAEVSGKSPNTPKQLISLIEKIESAYSQKGKWEAKINTSIGKKALSLEVEFVRQAENNESQGANSK